MVTIAAFRLIRCSKCTYTIANGVLLFLVLLAGQAWASPFVQAGKAEPRGDDWSRIVPAQVGAYKRTEFTPAKAGAEGLASYSGPGFKIYMQFGRAADEAGALNTLTGMQREAQLRKAKVTADVQGRDKYSLHEQGASIQYVWTRGSYYFSAVCEQGGKACLEVFVQSFPH
jgi:hypothetical protein